MDCFASLAMTVTHTFTFPRHDTRELCETRPRELRGRRESRVPAAPAAPRAKCRKQASASPQVHRNTRPSLRNGFNGFLRALPGDRAFLPPSSRGTNPAKLDASVGASGPHDFAVRISIIRPARYSRA